MIVQRNNLVLVLDFGAQYAQLIARRVRQANVYSEIVPSSITLEEILVRNPKAIIDRKSTCLNSSHVSESRMPSSA